jgi:hypothetical protein
MHTKHDALVERFGLFKRCCARLVRLQLRLPLLPFKMANTSQELLDLFEDRFRLADNRVGLPIRRSEMEHQGHD